MSNSNYQMNSSSSSSSSSISSSSTNVEKKQSVSSYKPMYISGSHDIQEPHSILEYSDMSRYKIGDNLGEGTYGNVHEAIDTKTGEIVAIKIMKDDYADGYNSDLLNELAYSLTMNHPNIIKYYVIVSDKNEEWDNLNTFKGLVMDKANGSLRTLIKDNFDKIDSNYVNMAYQLIDAGVYMSNHNIIHRDLKPGNIVYNKCDRTNDYWLRIIDFGSAISGECYQNKMSKIVYTLPYRPPEIVIANSSTYNSKADVWAMGCILYEMRVGSILFDPLHYQKDDYITYIDHVVSEIYDSSEIDALGLKIIWNLGIQKESNSDLYKKYLKWLKNVENKYDIYFKSPNMGHVSVIDKITGRSYDPELRDLLKRMLDLDPKTRISMKEVQKHPIFKNLAINVSVDDCYKLISSDEINCIARSKIFNRNLLFENIRYGPAPIILYCSILFPWMLEVCIEFKVVNIFQIYFKAIQIVLRYTNKIKQNSENLKKFMQLYGCTSLLLSMQINEEYIPIDDMIYISANTYNRKQMFENQHDILKLLNFDLLDSTPYDVIAGYSNIISDSVKDLALNILLISSYTMVYYVRVGNTEIYKYREDLPISCIIIAYIMINNEMPNFHSELNLKLCDYIINRCNRYVESDRKTIYLTGKLTKISLKKYIENYREFKRSHINTVRVLLIGRNNTIDGTMVRLLGNMDLSYLNSSNDSSLLSGIIPKEVSESFDKNYDNVIIDGADVAMKETIKFGMKILRSGGKLYSEYLLFSAVKAYNQRTERENISNIKKKIKSLNINKRSLLNEKRANKEMYMNENITVDKYNSNNAQINKSIRNLTGNLNSVRSELNNVDNIITINNIKNVQNNPELISYIASYLNPLHKQYGYRPNEYQIVYKYIEVVKK